MACKLGLHTSGGKVEIPYLFNNKKKSNLLSPLLSSIPEFWTVIPVSLQRVHLDIQVGEHAINYEQVATKDKLSDLQLRVRQLLDQVEQITKEQNFQRVSAVERRSELGLLRFPFVQLCAPVFT